MGKAFRWLSGMLPSGIFEATGWAVTSFGAQQALRFVTNLVIAWALAPHLLGTMLLINTLRTGGELLTDLGVATSIVRSPRGSDPTFYNTAWTVQIIRNIFLFGIAVTFSGPLARAFDDPQLAHLLAVTSIIFLITGLCPPIRALLQRSLQIRTLGLFDFVTASLTAVIHVIAVLFWPTIWGLVGALLVSSLATTLSSSIMMRSRNWQFRLDSDSVREIIQFGKWIFFSSIIVFASMNYDKLYFAKNIPFAVLGVYGIARTLGDTALNVFQHTGTLVLFPKVASSGRGAADLSKRIAPVRMVFCFSLAIVLGIAISLADVVVSSLYDDRYHAAGLFLAIILVGTWFAILATITDSIVMGLGRFSLLTVGNLGKFLFVVIMLPVSLKNFGIVGAICIMSASEAVRYIALAAGAFRSGVRFLKQDFFFSLFLFAWIILARQLVAYLSLTHGLGEWIEQAQGLGF